TFGQATTLSAAVAAADGATPTGTIDFTDETTGANLGTVLLAGGVASLNVSSLHVNTAGHVLRATYNPVGNFASSYGELTQNIAPAATTISLTSAPPITSYGDPVDFTASVSVTAPGVGPATGNVVFTIDGSVPAGGTVAVNGSGVAVFTTDSLTVGDHTV